jgi:Tfp pilus assembly protein PilN
MSVSRVNLLRPAPELRAHGGSLGRRWNDLAACIAILALTSGCLIWWWWSLQQTSGQAAADLLRAKQELTRLRTTISQTDARRRQSDALRQRIELLESLRGQQRDTLAVLEAIGSSIPGSCWLTSIVYETGVPVRIEGRARQLGSIFEFGERLEASRAFEGGVHVVESRLETNDADGPLVGFSVEGLSAAKDRVRLVAASSADRRAGTEQ